MQLFCSFSDCTWFGHGAFDGDEILLPPLADLVVHLVDLGRVHGPQAALFRVPVALRVLNLLETLVQRQVVTDGVL